jgi:hypothetical protein
MTVIAFPAPKDPLAFAGMGIKLDIEEQREIFDDLFMSVQSALLFCNFDYVEAEKAARNLIDAGLLGETGSRGQTASITLRRAAESQHAARHRESTTPSPGLPACSQLTPPQTPPSAPIARRGSLPFVHHMRQS